MDSKNREWTTEDFGQFVLELSEQDSFAQFTDSESVNVLNSEDININWGEEEEEINWDENNNQNKQGEEPWFSDEEEEIDYWDAELEQGPNSHPETSARETEKGIKESRFKKFSREEQEAFLEDQQNANTKIKTLSHIKLLEEFLKEENENRRIEEIPPNELNNYLEDFMLSVRKIDAEEYQPCTLNSIYHSIGRFLKQKKYTSDLKSFEFQGLGKILRAKIKVN